MNFASVVEKSARVRAFGIALAVGPALVSIACGPAPTARAAGATSASAATASATPADDRDAKLQRCVVAARACAAPVVAGDFVAAIACMPDDIVAVLGGRETLIAQAQKAAAEMKAGGGAILSFTVDTPSSVASSGTRTYAVVPTHVVVKVDDREGERNGYMLGISADDGQTWKFVDGVSPGLIAKLFPDFPKELVLPAPARTKLLPKSTTP